MKRAITALTLVCALMLSVVACQVYNPADNSTLYTAMRTEGAVSKADYLAKFEKAATAEDKAKFPVSFIVMKAELKPISIFENASIIFDIAVGIILRFPSEKPLKGEEKKLKSTAGHIKR